MVAHLILQVSQLLTSYLGLAFAEKKIPHLGGMKSFSTLLVYDTFRGMGECLRKLPES